MQHNPLPNQQKWHLPTKKCYRVAEDNRKSPNIIAHTDPAEVAVTVYDDKDCKQRITIKDLLTLEEEPRPLEQFGPAFVKKCDNSILAKAQLLRAETKYIKPNKWVEKYNIDLAETHKAYRKTFAHSKIKSFCWLLASHALPVGTRLFGKEANKKCPRCEADEEDIKHTLHSCGWVKKVREATFLEWLSRTGEDRGAADYKFKDLAFPNQSQQPMPTAWLTLYAIFMHHCWKDRCEWKYGRGEVTPPSHNSQ